MGGEELRPPPQHLLDGEIGAALEFQERRVRRQGAVEQFGLELELLQCAFAEALHLLKPFGFGRAVLRATVVVGEQLAHLRVCPRCRRVSRRDGRRALNCRCRIRRCGCGRFGLWPLTAIIS